MKQRFLLFAIISCIFSWACWLPVLNRIESSPFESQSTVLLLFFLGAYGPTITGIFLSFFFDGKEGIKSIKSRLKLRKSDTKWIVSSLIIGPILYGLALLVYVGFGGHLGEVNVGLLPWIPVIFIVSIILGPLAEEFGWRGFALPLLDPKANPILSSIIIGFIWALWHAPLFWAKSGTAISGFPVTVSLVVIFFIAVIGSSFIYTWLFNNTLGNISIAILLHLSMNASGTIRSMLFPNMGMEESWEFYKYYVVVLCCSVLLFSLLLRFIQQSKKAAISPKEINLSS